MTNRYPGKCTKCGQTVAPETGTCEKVNGKWVVTHTECPAAAAAATPEAETQTATEYIPAGRRSDLHRVGDVIKHDGQIVVVTRASHLVDEEAARGTYTVRRATEAEAAPLLAAAREDRRRQIAEYIRTNGTRRDDPITGGEWWSCRWTTRPYQDTFIVSPEWIGYTKYEWDGSKYVIPYDKQLADEIKAYGDRYMDPVRDLGPQTPHNIALASAKIADAKGSADGKSRDGYTVEELVAHLRRAPEELRESAAAAITAALCS